MIGHHRRNLARILRGSVALILGSAGVFGESSFAQSRGNTSAQEYGDAVYRLLEGKAGFLGYDYNHTAVFSGLDEDHKGRVRQALGADTTTHEASFDTQFKDFGTGYYGAYTLNNRTMTFADRKEVVTLATDLVDAVIDYPSTFLQAPVGIVWKGTAFDGSVGDIEKIRCDAFVEFCYEKNGFRVWRNQSYADDRWSIVSYPDYHNDRPDATRNPDKEASPWAQRGAPCLTGPAWGDCSYSSPDTKMNAAAVIKLPTYQVTQADGNGYVDVTIRATDESGIHYIGYLKPGDSIWSRSPEQPQDPESDSYSYTVRVTTSGTLYVYAKDNGGNYPGTTPGYNISITGPQLPGSPSNLVATAVSSSQINLNWNEVSNETSYIVERSTASGTFNPVKTLGENTTAWSDTGPSPGTAYFYRVKAHNSRGDSEYSSTASATTQPPPGTTVVLTIASSNPSSGVSVNIFWGPTGYQPATTPTSRTFSVGTSVGVTCPQSSAGGMLFQKWQLDGGDYAFADYVTVAMNASHTLTAIYGTSAPPARTLSSVTVEGPSSMNENSSAQFRARATYSDGSSGYVSPSWSEDSTYSTISSDGVFDVGDVSFDKIIDVRAEFTSGGIQRSDSKAVTVRNTNAVANYRLTINSTTGGSVGYSPQGSSYPADTVVSLHANADGSHIFSQWTGDASGTDDDIEVRMDRDRSVTANFVLDPTEGRLQVNISPPQAVAEGAQWKYRNYTEWRDSGNTQTNIPPGESYVNFKDIPGWIKPDEIKTSIVGAQTTFVNAAYREILGGVQVTIAPPEADTAGARWRMDGGPWLESGTTLNNVAPGNRAIEFQAVAGWQTPATQVIAVTRGNAVALTGSYRPPAGQPLITAISPETGPIEGGITVTVQGANFGPDASVTFGGVVARNVNVLSNSLLTAVLPARATYGSVSVSLISNGQSTTKVNGFTYDIPLGMNMTLLSQIGGEVQAVAVSGNSVIYGEGSSIVFADFSNPSAPIIRSRLPLPAIVRDIQIAGSHAIVANAASGVQIIDISNPAAMAKVGFYDTPGSAVRLVVAGNVAYVADSSGGLQIIDFTDRPAPRRVGSFAAATGVYDVGLSVIGGRTIACIANFPNGLAVLDVTDVAAVQQLSVIEPTVPLRNVAQQGDTIVVTGRRADNPSNLDGKVYSIANPSAPFKTREGFTSSNNVGLISGGAYYFGKGGDLEIRNLTSQPPSRLSILSLAGSTSGMALSGSTLFMANGDGGLIALNVGNPAAPVIRSTVNNGFDAGAVTVLGNTAYVAFGGSSSSTSSTAFPVVTALDITDVRRPQRGGTASFTETIERVFAGEDFLFGTSPSKGVASFGIQSPLSPTFSSTRASDRYTYGAAKLGQNLILGGSTKSGGEFPLLTVLDGVNASNNAPLSTFQLSTTPGVVNGVAVCGTTVFAFIENVGMRVLDYSNLASPRIIGAVDYPGYAFQAVVSADGRFVYAADFANGLRIIDCINPAAPILVRTYTRNGETNGRCVFLQGELVFYGDIRGLSVLDRANLGDPQLVAAYDTPGTPYGLFVAGNRVFAADDSSGLQILELGDLSRPIVEIVTPTRNSFLETGNGTIDLSGTASDAQGISRVTWNNDRGGGGIATGTTSWSIAAVRLSSGDNTITIQAEDSNGNVSSDTITIRATLPDTTAPVVTITGPKQDSQYEVNTPSIALTGTAVDGTGVVDLAWSNSRGGDGTIIGAGNWTVNLSLREGPNIVTVTAHDGAGNTGVASQVIFYSPPDTAPPFVTIDFPTTNSVVSTALPTVNISGTVSDNREVVEVQWDNDRGGSGIASAALEWWMNDVALQMGSNLITITAKDAAGNVGTDTVTVTYAPSFNVTSSAGAGGTINPLGTQAAEYGSSIAFTATPSAGWLVGQWLLDGVAVQTGGVVYTLNNITGSHSVRITFKAATFTVTPSHGLHGTITPSTAQTVNYGQARKFTATPTAGWEVGRWLLDGVAVQTGGAAYTLNNITANHTVRVIFKMATFTVTPSHGVHGVITPSMAQTVNYGQARKFAAAPTAGWVVDRWLMDGARVQTGGLTYTLKNVTANHTIRVTLKRRL